MKYFLHHLINDKMQYCSHIYYKTDKTIDINNIRNYVHCSSNNDEFIEVTKNDLEPFYTHQHIITAKSEVIL